MNKKSLLIVEIVWVIVGFMCIAAGIRFAVKTGGPRVLVFILMAVISFGFALIRHRQRKKN